MFSAEKAPFLVRFKVTTLGVTKVEEVALDAYKEFVNDEKPVSACSQKGHSRRLSKAKANPHSEIDQERLYGQYIQVVLTIELKNLMTTYQFFILAILGNLSQESPEACSANVSWKSAIFKVGDDVRQDMLALQLMRLMKDICDSCSLDVQFFPYNVVATGSGSGIIECVPNARSRDQIGRQTDSGFY